MHYKFVLFFIFLLLHLVNSWECISHRKIYIICWVKRREISAVIGKSLAIEALHNKRKDITQHTRINRRPACGRMTPGPACRMAWRRGRSKSALTEYRKTLRRRHCIYQRIFSIRRQEGNATASNLHLWQMELRIVHCSIRLPFPISITPDTIDCTLLFGSSFPLPLNQMVNSVWMTFCWTATAI